jgi:hypothetical protein
VLGILNVNSFVVHDGAEDGMDLIGRLIGAGVLEVYSIESVEYKFCVKEDVDRRHF